RFAVVQRSQCCQSVRVHFIREVPGQRDGAVDNEPVQKRRPSLMSSFNESPLRGCCLRNSRISSITCLTSRLGFSSMGTSRATGTPCLVMVKVSPFATRSSRRERWVFASKEPTVSTDASSNQLKLV